MLLWIGVEHEELAGVSAGVAQKFEAIGLGAGERVLVAEDDACGIVFEFAGANEAAASALLAGSGHGVFLRIGVERRDGILHDDVFADPGFLARQPLACRRCSAGNRPGK